MRIKLPDLFLNIYKYYLTIISVTNMLLKILSASIFIMIYLSILSYIKFLIIQLEILNEIKGFRESHLHTVTVPTWNCLRNPIT